MRDYEYLFATTLHSKLKESIIGKIYVEVDGDDELYVRITGYGDLKYEAWFVNFSDKFLHGWSVDTAAFEVVKEYRKFIMRRYFA